LDLYRFASLRVAAHARLGVAQDDLAQAGDGELVLGFLVGQPDESIENGSGLLLGDVGAQGLAGHLGDFGDGGGLGKRLGHEKSPLSRGDSWGAMALPALMAGGRKAPSRLNSP